MPLMSDRFVAVCIVFQAKEIVSMSMSQIQDLCKKDIPDMEDYLHYYLNMSKVNLIIKCKQTHHYLTNTI